MAKIKTGFPKLEKWQIEWMGKDAIKEYYKRYGKDAPVPDTPSKVTRLHVNLFSNGKRLCRYKRYCERFDLESRAVKHALYIKQAKAKYLKKYKNCGLLPNGITDVKGVNVYLCNDKNLLCQYNIHSKKISVTKAVVIAQRSSDVNKDVSGQAFSKKPLRINSHGNLEIG